MENCEKTERSSQTMSALVRNDDKLKYLMKAVDVLEKKLDCVLRKDPQSPTEGKDCNKNAEALVPLAERIEKITIQINILICQIESMAARLEL